MFIRIEILVSTRGILYLRILLSTYLLMNRMKKEIINVLSFISYDKKQQIIPYLGKQKDIKRQKAAFSSNEDP